MPIDPVTDFEIEAYIDGELDTERRMAVEDHLSRHADVAARVMADLKVRSALRLVLQQREPLPTHLADRAETLRQRLGKRRWRLSALMGFSTMGMAAAAAALMLVWPTLHGDVPSYVGDAVMSHRVGLMRAAMTSQVETPHFDAHEMLQSARIRMPVPLTGWRVTDVQLFPSDAGPALQFMIHTNNGQIMSMFATPTKNRATTQPVAVQRGDTAAAYWNRDGVSYALIGTLPANELDRAADDVADNAYF
jgi:anti-sigma factor RsiW